MIMKGHAVLDLSPVARAAGAGSASRATFDGTREVQLRLNGPVAPLGHHLFRLAASAA